MRLLQLGGLGFRTSPDPNNVDQRRQLLGYSATLRPTHVCVVGNIVAEATDDTFAGAAAWLDTLLSHTDVSADQCLVVPGATDLDDTRLKLGCRNASVVLDDSSGESATKALADPDWLARLARFSAFAAKDGPQLVSTSASNGWFRVASLDVVLR